MARQISLRIFTVYNFLYDQYVSLRLKIAREVSRHFLVDVVFKAFNYFLILAIVTFFLKMNFRRLYTNGNLIQ